MIRVLHWAVPDDAYRRLSFHGVPTEDVARLLENLRHFLLAVPRETAVSWSLPAILSGLGIPLASGDRAVFFSVSSRGPLDQWAQAHPGAAFMLRQLGGAIDRYVKREFTVQCRDKVLKIGKRPVVMGILNVTPDSFSDGGKFFSLEGAVRRGLELAQDGAEIIDVGGESTRPGSMSVPEEQELKRVIPVIRALAEKTEALLSIDTTKSVVAKEAIAAGAVMVNDTSALTDDQGMAELVRETGSAVILMHRKGTPATMQDAPAYESFFDEVLGDLDACLRAARKAGIGEDRILVDPGVGFGKRHEDNLALHRHFDDLRNLGKPVVFGPSRKSFIGTITGKDASNRVFGTAASVAWAARSGANILRVHDVREMKEIVDVTAAIAGEREC